MIELHQKVKPDTDVVVTELEEGKEAVLLHLGTKAYFTLNETGVRIWGLLSGDLTLDEIGTKLLEEFDVSPEKAGESVLALVRELVREKLVKVVDG
ncbi:MAG: PqqD family protein [Candidatus Scalindua sp.]|nr:PqqD family protein [Candidatus Scalindua sp.]